MKVEFFKHNLDEGDIANVGEAMRGKFLTTGDWVERFEQGLAGYLGREHAVGVTSATGGLHLALAAMGLGEGDEVITTPMSFVATANAIVTAGAKPVFVDVEAGTGNIDAALVEGAVTERTKAILPVHLYGVMCEMTALAEISAARGLWVLEDAAHALESERDAARPGDLSDGAVFSFYATKSITCGEGGAVVTDDETLAGRLRVLRLHGVTKGAAERHGKAYRHYDMEELGWKYNMSNIQAAILVGQIERIDAMRTRRESLARRYREGLREVEGVKMPEIPEGSVSGHHLFTIWVDRRDEVMARLEERGVGVAVNYRAIHLMKYYRERYGYGEGDFPEAERIGARTVSLPLYPKLRVSEVDFVVESVREAVGSG